MPNIATQNPKQLSFYSIFSAKGDDLDAIYARLGILGQTARSYDLVGPMIDTVVRMTTPPVRLTPEEKDELSRIAMHAIDTRRSTQQFLEAASLSPNLQNFATAAYTGLLSAVMRDEKKTATELLRAAADIPDHVSDDAVIADLPAIMERFCSHIGMPPLSAEKRAAIASIFAVNDMGIVEGDGEKRDPVFQSLRDLASEPELREFAAHVYAGFFARLTQVRMQPDRPDLPAQDQPEDNYLERAWGPGFLAETINREGGSMRFLAEVNESLDFRDFLAAAVGHREGAMNDEDDDGDSEETPRLGHDAPRG